MCRFHGPISSLFAVIGRPMRQSGGWIPVSSPFIATQCLLRRTLPAQKSIYLNRALKLHETVGGLQTLTVFKVDRMVDWQKDYENSVKILVEEYEKLRRTDSKSDRKE